MRKLWSSLGQGKQNDILSILFAALGILLFLSLLTHSSTDPSPFNRSSDQDVNNLIGKPGAWISDALFQFFGLAAFLIPALVLVGCFSWLRRRPLEGVPIRVLGILLSVLSGCGLLSLLLTVQVSSDHSGGILGQLVAELVSNLGKAGGGITLLALLIVSLIVAVDLELNAISAVIRNAAAWVLRWSRDMLDRLFTRDSEPDDQDDEEDWEPKKTLRTVDLFAPEEQDRLIIPDADEVLAPKPKPKPIRPKSQPPEPPRPKEREAPAADTPHPHSAERLVPEVSFLDPPEDTDDYVPMDEIERNSRQLERTLQDFGIDARVVAFQKGPVITRYEMEPPPGVKVNRITGLTDNLALSLKTSPIRVVAPIPGKGTVGVEVPNKVQQKVFLRQLIESPSFKANPARLTIALGKTLSGEPFYADLSKMPHLLIAGATGAGKSVCINTMITSFLFKATPEEIKFLMIDPKRVELRIYEDIPHLMAPVITDSRRAGAALRWVVEEMEDRFSALARISCRDLRSYNSKMAKMLSEGTISDADALVLRPFLPYIVVIIDELADLMTYARNDTEVLIASLAQKARAVGIHLVIATQRPSVNVLTGIIKANFPSRIAFQVASKVDSRTILDCNGAEALLGRGDMLFSSAASLKPIRIQGSFVTTEEIERVCDYLRANGKPEYLAQDFEEGDAESPNTQARKPTARQTTLFEIPLPSELEDQNSFPEDVDLFDMAKQIVIETGTASTSLLQRRLKIGYGRAARFLDQMEQEGIVGPPRGSRPREVLLDDGSQSVDEEEELEDI